GGVVGDGPHSGLRLANAEPRGGESRAHLVPQRLVGEGEVDETGAGNLGGADERRAGEVGGDLRGDLPRGGADLLRQRQRNVRLQIRVDRKSTRLNSSHVSISYA